MESTGQATAIYRKKSSRNWLEKTSDRVLLVHNQHSINGSIFATNSLFFSCALHSDDSSWHVSDEKLLRRQERFNQSNSQVLYQQPTFQIIQILNCEMILKFDVLNFLFTALPMRKFIKTWRLFVIEASRKIWATHHTGCRMLVASNRKLTVSTHTLSMGWRPTASSRTLNPPPNRKSKLQKVKF